MKGTPVSSRYLKVLLVEPPEISLRVTTDLLGFSGKPGQLAAELPGGLEEGLEAIDRDAESAGGMHDLASHLAELGQELQGSLPVALGGGHGEPAAGGPFGPCDLGQLQEFIEAWLVYDLASALGCCTYTFRKRAYVGASAPQAS
jgi:hypothetical protein